MHLMWNVSKSIIALTVQNGLKMAKVKTVIIEFTINIRSLKKVKIYEIIGLQI